MQGDLLYQLNKLTFAFFFFFQGNIDFFKEVFFLMWTVFIVFIEFVIILLLFYVLALWPQGLWYVSSPIWTEPIPSALKGEVFTTGPPGKSPKRDLGIIIST